MKSPGISSDQLQKGARLIYNDGRPGHSAISGTVLTVEPSGMLVQFEDRADTNYIQFADKAWMDHLQLAPQSAAMVASSQEKLSELRDMIAGTVAAFPVMKDRWQAMRAIQWRLRGPHGEFVGLNRFQCAFVPESQALIFDGRDNEAMKLAMYESALGPLTVEILPQIS